MGKYLIKIKKENEKKRAVPAKNKKKEEKPKSDTESMSSDSSVEKPEDKPQEAPTEILQEPSVEELDFDEQLKLIMNVKNEQPQSQPTSTPVVKSVPVSQPMQPISSRRSNQPVGSRGATVSSRRTF